MGKKPLLSVIIISLNEEKYLPNLLESLKKQTFKNFEVILSDFNSKDKTREIAKRYGCKIILGGKHSVARNNGAKVARADYLLFLDADSVLPNDFIEVNLKKFIKTDAAVGTEKLKPLSNKFSDKFLFGAYHLFVLMLKRISPLSTGCGIFVRKDIFKKINGFDEKVVVAEDHDFAKRAKKYGFVILPREIYTSIRRVEKEGRLKFASKILYMGLYRIILRKEITKKIVAYNNIR